MGIETSRDTLLTQLAADARAAYLAVCETTHTDADAWEGQVLSAVSPLPEFAQAVLDTGDAPSHVYWQWLTQQLKLAFASQLTLASQGETRRHYIRCEQSQVPRGVRYDAPRHLQGQIVLVEYGGFERAAHDDGAPYKRVCDTSEGRTWTYYRLVEVAS